MTQTSTRIAELMARLSALDCERAAIVAEIETLQSAPSEQTAAINVIPSEKAGDLVDRHSTIEKRSPYSDGFSAAVRMSSPSGGRIARQGAAATHLPVLMNGSVGFAKSRK